MTEEYDRGQGIHGHGGRGYSAKQARVIAQELGQHVGPRHAITVEALSDATRVDGRAIRQYFYDYDCTLFGLGEMRKGIFVAEYAEDVERRISRLQAQVSTMQERITRMLAYAQRMKRRQDRLL